MKDYQKNKEYAEKLSTLMVEQAKADFKAELKMLIKQKLDEINHYVSGCDSPFSYTQIRGVQGLLNDIIVELDINTSEEKTE